MLATVNFHAPVKSALAGGSRGAPLTIGSGSIANLSDTSVCFFMEDHELASKLANAINRTIAEHEAAIAAPLLQAAE